MITSEQHKAGRNADVNDAHNYGETIRILPNTKRLLDDQGMYHSLDEPAVISLDHPTAASRVKKHWFVHGVRHRDGGPAIEHNDGSEVWMSNGVRHRVDGPAVINYSRPENTVIFWCWHGEEYSFEDYTIKAEWSVDQIVEYKIMNDVRSNFSNCSG